MIPFNLEKALAGEKVVTRAGQPITQLVKFKTYSGSILYGLHCDEDSIESWLLNGKYHDSTGDCDSDLFMAPKKLSGFVNVYEGGMIGNMYSTAKDAHESASDSRDRLACIDLSQLEEGHGL